MTVDSRNGFARRWYSVYSGVWAHGPTILAVALFFLASVILLDSNDHQITLSPGNMVTTIAGVLPFFLGTGLFLGLIWLVLTHTRNRSVANLLRWIGGRDWLEILVMRPLLAFGLIFVVNYLHLSFKVNIPAFGPYSWDHFFAATDKLIFLGNDPWTVTHGILSDYNGTIVLDSLYHIWFLVLQFCVIGVALLPFRNDLRLTFLLAYVLNWTIGGVLLALLMPAVGPVYMEPLTGDPMFQPLMNLLQEQSRFAPIAALEAQEWLWDGLTNPEVPPVGVSAFPSLHVEIAATCAYVGFGVSRAIGWALTAFTAMILVGSVHLGWHYAIDGIIGIFLAIAIWRISAQITQWWLARTEPLVDLENASQTASASS